MVHIGRFVLINTVFLFLSLRWRMMGTRLRLRLRVTGDQSTTESIRHLSTKSNGMYNFQRFGIFGNIENFWTTTGPAPVSAEACYFFIHFVFHYSFYSFHELVIRCPLVRMCDTCKLQCARSVNGRIRCHREIWGLLTGGSGRHRYIPLKFFFRTQRRAKHSFGIFVPDHWSPTPVAGSGTGRRNSSCTDTWTSV